MNGSVNLCELFGSELETDTPEVSVTASPEEHQLLEQVLTDFVSAPMDYDLSEMCSEEEMQEMAELCKELLEELYG